MTEEKGLLLCEQDIKTNFGGSKIVKDNENLICISNKYNNLKKEDKLEILKFDIEIFYEEIFKVKKESE